MRSFKNIGLMLLVNIAIIVSLSILLSALGLEPYMQEQGLNYESLAIFCLVWGMGASFISLLISKKMAKWTMGVRIVDAQNSEDPGLRKVYEMLRRSSQRAGLETVPEFGVYDSPEMNAFATGPSKKRSLVAVSTGLLNRMDDNEVEGVIAHEVAHIANGDMVTMTLLQGVINALIMFIARVIAFFVASRFDRESRYWIQFVTIIVAQIALGVLGLVVTSWFSRKREFRADAGAAQFVGREKMVAALEALRSPSQEVDGQAPQMAALKISNPKKSGSFTRFFMSHPPLDERIEALKMGQASS